MILMERRIKGGNVKKGMTGDTNEEDIVQCQRLAETSNLKKTKAR